MLGKKNKKEEKLRHNARITSVKEGCIYGASEGTGLRYVTQFALAIGANNAQIGLLTSVASLFGHGSQLFTERLMEKFSRKRILFWGIILQAICWLLMIGVGISFFVFNWNIAPSLLIVVYTLLGLFGAIIVPAWNSWMRDVVDAKQYGEYFGFRSRSVGIVTLITMLIGGFVLDYFKNTNLFAGFIILFGIAFLARTISGFMILKIYEPKLLLKRDDYFSLWQFLKRYKQSNFVKFVIYTAFISFAASIASPFFTVYNLTILGFSYTAETATIVINSIAMILFLPFWGKVSDKYGNLKVVKIATLLIPIVPLLWLGTLLMADKITMIAYIAVVNIFSGFVWAGFNLCAVNFIYDAVSREKTALCSAYFNVMNGFGIFFGALIGGLLASIENLPFGISALILVFVISGIMRYVGHLFFRNKVVEEKQGVKQLGIKKVERALFHLTPKKLVSYLNIDLHHRIK